METLNLAKGYGRVDASEDNSGAPPNLRRRRRFIAISLAILLTIIIASFIAALIHESLTESEESETSPLASNSNDALKAVCSVTRYPDSCFSSISPLNSPPSNDPLRFFNLSLHASLIEVSSLKSQLAESKADPATKDCAELFDDAVSQLGRSAESICVGPGEKKVLTEMRISDLQSWISAAMTDQDTCLDGLAEMGSTAVADFKLRVQRSEEYMSNSLAILNNIQSLFQKFGLTMP